MTTRDRQRQRCIIWRCRKRSARLGAGFTLIELLVVLGIIGILASFFLVGASGARSSSRDNRRVADLKQVQQALQLYFLKCGMYPGKYDSVNGCGGGIVSATQAADNPGTWLLLESTLSGAAIGFPDIPYDPTPGQSYQYHVQLGDMGIPPTPRAQCYVLSAAFETNHKALQSDLDGADLVKKLEPKTKPLNTKNFYSTIPSCDDSGAMRGYCVGNIECFYGP